MPQVRKDEVEARITDGALATFAERGYEDATMAEIARAAGVSTGNLYRYFASKEEMFEAVVGDAFVTELLRLLRGRIEALAGMPGAYAQASEELLAFCIANRLRVVILLGRARGSRHERVRDDLLRELVTRAEAHFERVTLARPERFVLERVYRGLLDTTVDVLATHAGEPDIRAAIAAWTRYHLTGMAAFFAR